MKSTQHTALRPRTFVLPVQLFLFVLPVAIQAEVKVFPSPEHDVSTYKTYEWMAPRVMTRQGLLEDDAVLAPIIKRVVNQHLKAKGYVEVEQGGQLKVLSGGFSETNNQLEGFIVTYGFDYYWGWGPTSAAPVSRVNREGTLLVGLIDAETSEGVWLGLATAMLGSPKNIDKTIDKAASKMLKKLPSNQEATSTN